VAIGLWATQNALNAVWTPVYFGLRRMKAALILLGALWLAVAGTIWSFWQLDPIAGMILIPYLVWVSFAGLLNFSFMRLNPDYAT
jgi:tryptophan-rich sensory protein